MKLEDLVIRLKIKEDNKIAEKKSCNSSKIIGVIIVEEDPTEDQKKEVQWIQVRTCQEETQGQLLQLWLGW